MKALFVIDVQKATIGKTCALGSFITIGKDSLNEETISTEEFNYTCDMF